MVNNFAKPQQIINRLQGRAAQDLTFPEDDVLRKLLNYTKRKRYPKEPANLEEVDLANIKTYDEDSFLLYDNMDTDGNRTIMLILWGNA